jgi:hypothetical protein
MKEQEAVRAGYRAVPPAVAEQIRTGRQSLAILNNVVALADKLAKEGKFVKIAGLGGVIEGQILKYKTWAKDPDLSQWQAESTQLISVLRNLGDKGVRAIGAFEGATNLINSGAPYHAVKQFLEQLDNEVRSGAPLQAPQAYDNIPGPTSTGGETSEELPDPKPLAGRTIKDNQTGQHFRSDGNRWLPVR